MMKIVISLTFLFLIIPTGYSQGNFSFDSTVVLEDLSFDSLHSYHFPLNSGNMFSEGKWNEAFSVPGIRGIIYATCTDGTNLYVGGNFTIAGNTTANSIAKWDGHKWTSVGEGDENGVTGEIPSVHALAWADGKLFAGGQFHKAGKVEINGIAYFDGEKWNNPGEGVRRIVRIEDDTLIMDGFIWALYAHENKIYAGGSFQLAGEDTSNGVAIWDIESSKWESMDGGLKGINEDDPVSAYAFAADSNIIYVGGTFRYAGELAAENVAAWNGTDWISIGKIDHFITDMEVDTKGNVYVASKGNPQYDAGESGILKWDGSGWSSIMGPDNYKTVVSSIEIIDSLIYAGGFFDIDSYVGDYSFATYDGEKWKGIPDLKRTQTNRNEAYIVCMEPIGNSIFLAGEFTKAGNYFPVNVVEWKIPEAAWSILPGDPQSDLGLHDGYIRAMTQTGDTLYAGGTFTVVGGIEAHSIALFTDNAWHSLGRADSNGINGWVYAVLAEGKNVYVGGSFNRAGPEASFHIARWDGKKWYPMGIGVGGVSGAYVYALAKVGNYVYAGGYFSVVGDVDNFELPANSIARFNLLTERWESLGDGIQNSDGSPGRVYDMEVDDNRIIIGGEFEKAGGVNYKNLVAIEETEWQGIDGENPIGIDGTVRVVKIIDDQVYIGGYLYPEAESHSAGILKLEGTGWSHVGEPFAEGNFFVTSIAEFDSGLFAGGFFNSNENDLNNLAWFDGHAWSSVGGGVFPGVTCMAAFKEKLFIGGPINIITSEGLNVGIAQFDYNFPVHTGIENGMREKDFGNYPNPFDRTTTIYFNLDKPGVVKIQLFDSQGRLLRTIMHEGMRSGTNEVLFNAGNLPAGLYFYRLITPDQTLTGEMITGN